jgi:hypothetical protein
LIVKLRFISHPKGAYRSVSGKARNGISSAAGTDAHIERRKAYIDQALFVDMHPFGCSIYRSASAFAVRYAAKAARYAPLRAREPADKPKFESKLNRYTPIQFFFEKPNRNSLKPIDKSCEMVYNKCEKQSNEPKTK